MEYTRAAIILWNEKYRMKSVWQYLVVVVSFVFIMAPAVRSEDIPAAPVDVINGQEPLEHLQGVHPRLHFTAAKIEALKGEITREPWKGFYERVRKQADRGVMPNPALVYLLTGEDKYLAISRKGIDALIAAEWPENIQTDSGVWGQRLYILALSYDWLYHALDQDTRARLLACIETQGRKHFDALARYEIYQSSTYGWNIASDYFLNVLAAGAAIYGDTPNISPWLRFSLDRARLITDALGSDGASPEGICYGGFFDDTYVRTLDLIAGLQGWDYFQGNAYLRNVSLFYLYSMLPRASIDNRSVHLCFGDGVRYNWYGPSHFLRKLAAVYHDPYAAWVADTQEATGANADAAPYLNLAWYDPGVTADDPSKLPTFHHFADKGLVIMRSGWDGNESVFGFKCGPHAGFHALNNYQQSIGGGHMAPDAGSFLLFAHGDWLISDGAYAMKQTAYRNTMLVNGIGQTGEGGTWFECTPLRHEKRGPAILHTETAKDHDYLIADVAPAYEPQAGLTKFLRHVLYLKPDCWVIIDELAAKQPSTFELLFHATGSSYSADRPFVPDGTHTWITGGTHGKLRLTAFSPLEVRGSAETQQIKGIGENADRTISLLRLSNPVPQSAAVFVTVLEAYPAAEKASLTPTLTVEKNRLLLTLKGKSRTTRVTLTPGQADTAKPIFRLAR